MAKLTAGHLEGEPLANPTASLQSATALQAAGTSLAHREHPLLFNPSHPPWSTSGFCRATSAPPDNLSSGEFVTDHIYTDPEVPGQKLILTADPECLQS